MSLPSDLLEQAKHLSKREQQGPPKQASLRRAVSAAYYAVFHLLAQAAAAAHAPGEPAGLRYKLQRTLDHGLMKDACNRVISSPKLSSLYAGLLGDAEGHSAELIVLAKAFVALQEARHTADYDLTQKHSRSDVLRLIEEADWAFLAWNAIRATPETNIFLSDLLFGRRLTRF